MPSPGSKESRKDFISRCIPIVLKEGTAKDNKQAAAICHSIWEKKGSAEMVEDKDTIKQLIAQLELDNTDNARLRKLLEDELGSLEDLQYGKISEIFGTEGTGTTEGT